jgi:hypothetical protein
MTERLACLELIDSYIAGAMIAHEYAYGLHRKLVDVDADTGHTRKLLGESAAVALEMPALRRRLLDLERKWSEQELLDPPAAQRTVRQLENAVAGLVPELAVLSNQHKQVLAELLDLVRSVS